MGDVAIHAANLSKRYYIGGQQEPYKTLRDTLVEIFTAPLWRARDLLLGRTTGAAGLKEELWALQDISFEIKRGEVVGIIGHNGAGKSTLLKVLSRITEPTCGYAEIHGRIGSLLEVGTGFHPELTGRENIYLNGAILGMRRVEIGRRFDEIVAFAEVERFIDTPVKHYSSGMYLRLGFAVAAHFEPEILIVDEVLAVGDARFQKKCLNKMQDVGKEGRTVLFVSHNLPAITRLCDRAILLGKGGVLEDGAPQKVVSAYLNAVMGTAAEREWADPARAPGGDVARLSAVRVRGEDGRVSDAHDIRRPIAVEMEYEVLKPGYILLAAYYFYNEEGIHAFTAVDQDPTWRMRPRPAGRYTSTAWVPGNLLSEGTMFVHAIVTTLNPAITQFNVSNAVTLQIIDSLEGNSARGDIGGRIGGVVRPLLKWRTEPSSGKQNTSSDVHGIEGA